MRNRTDEQKLDLFVRKVAWIVGTRAVTFGGTKLELTFDKTGLRQTLTEPPDEEMRALLTEARKLDAPSEDASLQTILPILQTQVLDPAWRRVVDQAAVDYAAAQGTGPFRIEDPDRPGTILTGRELFELWVYGEVLHDDYDKQAKIAKLATFRPIVRAAAHDYLTTLLVVAVNASRAARGSGLVTI